MLNKKNILLIVSLLCSSLMNAQCAMCKAAIESDESGSTFNSAILYLMTIPYLIGLGVAIAFFVNKRKKQLS